MFGNSLLPCEKGAAARLAKNKTGEARLVGKKQVCSKRQLSGRMAAPCPNTTPFLPARPKCFTGSYGEAGQGKEFGQAIPGKKALPKGWMVSDKSGLCRCKNFFQVFEPGMHTVGSKQSLGNLVRIVNVQ